MSKKKYKLLLRIVILFGLMAVFFTGCKNESDNYIKRTRKQKMTTTKTGEIKESVFKADSKHVKILGHALYEDDSLWMVQSASGAEFTFYGDKATITFEGDSTAVSDESDMQARIGVFVNDELVTDVIMDEKIKKVDVYESESPSEVTVKVVKLSEALYLLYTKAATAV